MKHLILYIRLKVHKLLINSSAYPYLYRQPLYVNYPPPFLSFILPFHGFLEVSTLLQIRVGREGSHYDVAEMAIVYSKKKCYFINQTF